jgi:hypothetical protein
MAAEEYFDAALTRIPRLKMPAWAFDDAGFTSGDR